jgi:hypothetical protein
MYGGYYLKENTMETAIVINGSWPVMLMMCLKMADHVLSMAMSR